ncbi:hypothetical protein [Enterovirga sp.]|mgnify:CR=1 FL=1|uniref:hypothetical protein n=1 Tax=Enterovirga sp. TaxID=2026350 RepID=UPI002BE693FA|nr:hypothetical protein [Enterovirga sp.]HMO28072.1 hypothetical protein [Enterovirga sp.]
MRFVFTHSHAFPGSRVSVEEDGEPGPGCLVEFSDGTIVMSECRMEGEDILLHVPPYRTARKHAVEGRTWQLSKAADGTWRCRRAPE